MTITFKQSDAFQETTAFLGTGFGALIVGRYHQSTHGSWIMVDGVRRYSYIMTETQWREAITAR